MALHRISFQIIILLITHFSALSAANTYKDIIEREKLICGVRGGSFGLGKVNKEGKWEGLDVDFCRAIAAATLRDTAKVEYVPLSNKVRFKALQDNDIDVLIRNTTWTFSRDTSLGVEFVGINFYDGQGLIGWKKKEGWKKLADYESNTKICMIRSTTSLVNLKDYLAHHNRTLKIIEHDSTDVAANRFFRRKCDLFSSDRSELISMKQSRPEFSDDLIILDDVITKEPLGPVVRDNDPQWKDIVQWTFFATIEAEERGIYSTNIDDIRKQTKDPAIRYMLGVDPGIGKPLGLDDEWIYRIIKKVGNYGEIFERNMGHKSELGLKRGLNNLWTRGGLLYSPPIR